MAAGNAFEKSVKMASSFALEFIKNSRKIGNGFAIVGSKRVNSARDDLSNAIYEFTNMKNASNLIPECQTNFAYAAAKPKTIKDVFGVRGRIVCTGQSVTVCGVISAGGSKHVASAIIQMCAKFPTIRSAINIRYDESIVKRIKSAKMRIASYDRSVEPSSVKKTEGEALRGAYVLWLKMQKPRMMPYIIQEITEKSL